MGLPESVSVVSVSGTTTSLVGLIQGDKTGLDSPFQVAVDSMDNVYVANSHVVTESAGITEYAAGATGNIAPIAHIQGPNTSFIGPIGPDGVALDKQNNIYAVMEDRQRLLEFSAGSNGNVAPIINVFGPNTQLNTSTNVAVDSSGKIYVANAMPALERPAPITIYSPGSTGNVAPVATIGGPNTTLGEANGVAVDSSGKIYVSTVGEVAVFAPGSNGDVKPIAVISGSATGFTGSSLFGVAIH